MINGRLNILYLIFVATVYYTRFVSSLTLDLNNLSNSGFYTLTIIELGMIKTMVFSTPDKPITEIRKGCRAIWSALPGESARSITHIISKRSKIILMTIEINNPSKDPIYYLNRCRTHYIYITQEQFEREFIQLSYPPPGKVPIARMKRSEPITEPVPFNYKGTNAKKLRKLVKKPETKEIKIGQREPPTEPLVPETVQVEVESDEEETETQQLQPSIDKDRELLSESLVEEEVEKLLERELRAIGLSNIELDSILEESTEEYHEPNKED